MSVISIIIPVYNGVKYIERAVSMILSQTYRDVEAIFIDDGSTDGTWDLLCKATVQLERVILIRKVNGGVSSARNAGLAKATGDYIIFADIDDLWESTYAEKLLSCLTKKNVELAICGYKEISIEGKELFHYQSNREEYYSPIILIQNCLQSKKICTALWNKAFCMDVIRKHTLRFDETLSIGEDMLFLVEYCLNIQQAIEIPCSLYHYVKNPEGTMQSRKYKNYFQVKWLSEWKSIQKVEQKLNEVGIQTFRELETKKTNIAIKILKLMTKYEYKNIMLTEQMSQYIRKNINIFFKSPRSFTYKNIFLGMLIAINPNLIYLCRIIFRNKGRNYD